MKSITMWKKGRALGTFKKASETLIAVEAELVAHQKAAAEAAAAAVTEHEELHKEIEHTRNVQAKLAALIS